jgi:hypothetical protein|nr:tetratricopeptide repeat protein [Kofleriaceae bacterium]
MRRGVLLVFAVIGVIAASAPARADDTAGQPWAQGVTADQKAAAKKLLDDGNARFVEHDYAGALASYQAAIAQWDHPAIRFNIVRCLIQLDRPVEAYDHLQLALKYGSAPLEDSVYTEAVGYQKLLAKQVGEIAIACDQAGVEVTLDGKDVASCPAKLVQRIAPGPHQVVGQKAGFPPRTLRVVVEGGARADAQVTLVPLKDIARVDHRWAAWKPWVVFGAGFAVAGVGGLVEAQAATNMDAFDRAVSHDCAPNGCARGSVDTQSKSRAQTENVIAIGVMSIGAAAIAAGVVGLYLNRGRTVYETPALAIAPERGGAAVVWTTGW